MPSRPAIVLLLVTAACLISACGGRAARNDSQALLQGEPGEKWFCQVAEDLESWDCVQSDALAAAPRPIRMPVARATDEDERPRSYDPIAAAELEAVGLDEPVAVVADASEAVAVDESGEAVAVEVTDVTAVQGTDVPAVQGTDVPAVEATDVAAGKDPGAAAGQEPEVVTEEQSVAVATAPTEDAAGATPPEPMAHEAGGAEIVSALPFLDFAVLPDDAFLIQLVAMRSLETLERVARDRELEDVLAARVAANGEIYHVLLVGPYSNEIAAQEVAAAPPKQLADFQLWVRSAESLKQAADEADALAAAAVPASD